MERVILQFAADPAEMSKLFRLLSQQFDVKRVDSNAGKRKCQFMDPFPYMDHPCGASPWTTLGLIFKGKLYLSKNCKR